MDKEIKTDIEHTDDLIRSYFHRAGQYKLLTAAEEIELSRLGSEGDLKARDKLINSNLRLVINIAQKYIKSNLPFADLIQEGNLGLMKAVERFDHTRGYRFTTYATWWIKQAIGRAIDNSAESIRLPIHYLELVKRIKKIYRECEAQNKEIPTDEDLAELLKKPLKTIQSAIANIDIQIQRTASYNTPIQGGSDFHTELVDVLPSEEQGVVSEAISAILKTHINELLSSLPTEKHKQVIIQRFGLNGESPKTLKEIGEIFGVCRERIRQLEKKSMAILKRSPAIHKVFIPTE